MAAATILVNGMGEPWIYSHAHGAPHVSVQNANWSKQRALLAAISLAWGKPDPTGVSHWQDGIETVLIYELIKYFEGQALNRVEFEHDSGYGIRLKVATLTDFMMLSAITMFYSAGAPETLRPLWRLDELCPFNSENLLPAACRNALARQEKAAKRSA